MKKIFLQFLVFTTLFSSCSRLNLALQFADTYVANKADDYFDLTKKQMTWVKINFEKDLLQVQKNIFPQIAKEFFKISDMISTKRPIEVTTVMITYERLKNLFYDGMRVFSSDIVLFADQLIPTQISYFQKTFDKKMRNLKEDESSKDSAKAMKKHFESWMGSISSIQKEELEKFSTKYPPQTNEKIYNRQLLAHEFINSYANSEARKHFLVKLTTHFEETYEANFSNLTKERNNKIAWLVASILNKISDEQRDVLVDTLRDRANQLIKISKT